MNDDRPAVTSPSLGSLVQALIRAVETVLPRDFRGKILFGEIDKGRIKSQNVTVEYRGPQPQDRVGLVRPQRRAS